MSQRRRKSERTKNNIFKVSLLMVKFFEKSNPVAIYAVGNASFRIKSYSWCIFPLRQVSSQLKQPTGTELGNTSLITEIHVHMSDLTEFEFRNNTVLYLNFTLPEHAFPELFELFELLKLLT